MLLNTFLERNMSDALEDHQVTGTIKEALSQISDDRWISKEGRRARQFLNVHLLHFGIEIRA